MYFQMSELYIRTETVEKVFDPFEYHTDLCNQFYSSSCLSFKARMLTLNITFKVFSQICYVHNAFIGTIQFYHFAQLSMTLTCGWSEQKTTAVRIHFLAHFSIDHSSG